MEGKIECFVCDYGGRRIYIEVGKHLKEQNSNIKAVPADLEGSTIGGRIEG